MNEESRFVSDVVASLTLAVRATEHLEAPSSLTGLSEFTAHSLTINKLEPEGAVASVDMVVEDTADVAESIGLDTDSIVIVEDAQIEQEIAEDEESVLSEATESLDAPDKTDIYELQAEEVQPTEEDYSTLVAETSNDYADAALEEEKPEVYAIVDSSSVVDELISETESTEALVEDASTTLVEEVEEVVAEPIVSDEDWAFQEFGSDSVEIEHVAELSLDDIWDTITEPEAEESIVPIEARKEKDQVVLVVDQLVVSPQQGTTVLGLDGQPMQQGPVRPVQYAQPAQGPIVYQAPPAPQPIVNAAPTAYPQQPVVQPPMAYPQQPAYQQAPPVYNPPEVNISISAPASAPQTSYVGNVDASIPTTDAPIRESADGEVPVYEAPVVAEQHMPQEVAEKLREPDQVIEIRSDATSISANNVTVSSGSSPLPSLVNFDPRKYFSPNDIIPPKLEATIRVEQVAPGQGEYTQNPDAVVSIPAYQPATVSSRESLNAVVMPNEEPIVPLLKDETMGDASSRVTQMFGELRRFRDK